MLKITLSLLILSGFTFAEDVKCVEHEMTPYNIYECKMPNNDICYIRNGKMSCVSHQK
jgi:hypothetical protein